MKHFYFLANVGCLLSSIVFLASLRIPKTFHGTLVSTAFRKTTSDLKKQVKMEIGNYLWLMLQAIVVSTYDDLFFFFLSMCMNDICPNCRKVKYDVCLIIYTSDFVCHLKAEKMQNSLG